MIAKDQKVFLNKKRVRNTSISRKLDITLDQKEIFMTLDNANYRIVIESILENGLNKIYLQCSNAKSSIRYEVELGLDNLKERCKTFRMCIKMEEAFKILKNLFYKRKVKIKEKTEEYIILVITVYNCIEFKEENINFTLTKRGENTKVINNIEIKNNDNINNLLNEKINLEKSDNISGAATINTLNNNSNYINKKNIKKPKNIENNFSEIDEKLNLLIKNDGHEDIKLRKLIIHGGEMLSDCYRIKTELNNIKKFVEERSKNDENENTENKENEVVKDSENKIEQKEKKEYESPEEKEENEKNDQIIQSKLDKKMKIRPKKTRFQCMNVSSPPKLIYCKDIIDKAFIKYWGDNNFITFDSMYNEKFLVYGTVNYSIYFYDLKQEKVSKKIRKAHDHYITNFRHTFDKNYARDLLLTISDTIKNIKVWDVKNMDCLVNIRKAYEHGFLFSACFLIDEQNKMNYIISVNYDKEFIKIFDFEGKMVDSINNSEDKSLLVDSFKDTYLNKYYIIVGNEKNIISYDFETKNIYHKYFDSTSIGIHIAFVFNFIGKEVRIVESDTSGYIRIWDFNSGSLLNKCLVGKNIKLRGICLWNQNYLFVGSDDKKIKLIDLDNGVKINSIKCNDCICTIKKINHPIYGECLVFDGKGHTGQIYLWKKADS